MNVTQIKNTEIIEMNTLEQIDDILKRLHTIENCLLALTPIIDMAHEYDDRLTQLEKEVFCMSQSLENINETVVDEIPAQAQAPITLEGQELDQARVVLINEVNNRYMGLLQFITALPIENKKIIENAILNLDQGLLWINQGLRSAVIQAMPANQTEKEQENGERKNETEGESEQSTEGTEGKDA